MIIANSEIIKKLINKLERRKLITDKGCWELLDFIPYKSGYYYIKIKSKRFRVIRVSATFYLGLDLDDKDKLALHKNICNNKKCWNPEHLYVGNASNNVKDYSSLTGDSIGQRMRKIQLAKTHCIRGHELSGHNLVKRRNKRECRECINIKQRERRSK